MLPDFQQLAVPGFPHAGELSGVWAIEPTAGAALWRQFQGMDLRQHMAESPAPKLAAATEYQTIRAANGEVIAQINLTGTLMKSASSMSAATSTVAARRAIRKAAADSEVSAILIAIDSPGGTVSGTADLGSEIAAAAKKKPVWSYIDDLGASAAYWAASQADRVIANNRTALVGSIGTLAVVYDLSAAAEKEGIKALVFGTGPLKGTGTPGAPVTEDQQAYYRGIVEDAQVAFDAAVSKGRSLTAKQLADVKTGGVFGATEAQDKKLIDAIQSFDATVSELAAEARRQSRSQTRAASPDPVRSATVNPTVMTETGAVATADVLANDKLIADAIERSRKAHAAEAHRVAGINDVCKKHPKIAAKAIEEGWSVEKAENAALKADLADPTIRAAGPHFAFHKQAYAPGVSRDSALEAALRMSFGSRGFEKDYSADVLESARSAHRSLSLQGLFLLAAQERGYPVHADTKITQGNLREVLRYGYGLEGERVAGTSTVSLPGILGNVANKELLGGYMEGDQTWREVAAIKNVSNFQQATSYRLLDSMEYEEVGPDGKLKHGSTDQESYTRQAKTYGKMYSLTRRDIINDDLGAFQDLRTRLGRGSAKKFNNVFWAKFLYDHATFFTTARTNYITGATTNLGSDGVGLSLGIKAFRQMVSPSTDGAKRVGGNPDRVIVPPELEGIAQVLYRNQNLGSVKSSDANIYANLYRPVVVPWLSDSSFTGYSATAWYLLRDPADLAMVVVSFLNGMQSPTVESADADFDTLGIQFRGYHDFGVDQAEYLAGVKSKGAA